MIASSAFLMQFACSQSQDIIGMNSEDPRAPTSSGEYSQEYQRRPYISQSSDFHHQPPTAVGTINCQSSTDTTIGPPSTPMPSLQYTTQNTSYTFSAMPTYEQQHHYHQQQQQQHSFMPAPSSTLSCSHSMPVSSPPLPAVWPESPSLLTSAYSPGQASAHRNTVTHAIISSPSNAVPPCASGEQTHLGAFSPVSSPPVQHFRVQSAPFSPPSAADHGDLLTPFTSPHLAAMTPTSSQMVSVLSPSALPPTVGISREPSPGAIDTLNQLASPPLSAVAFPDGHPLSVNTLADHTMGPPPPPASSEHYASSPNNTAITPKVREAIRKKSLSISAHRKSRSLSEHSFEDFSRIISDHIDSRASFSGVLPWQTTESMYSPSTVPPRFSLSLNHTPPAISITCSSPMNLFPPDLPTDAHVPSLDQLSASTLAFAQPAQDQPGSGSHTSSSSNSSPVPGYASLPGNIVSAPSTPVISTGVIPPNNLIDNNGSNSHHNATNNNNTAGTFRCTYEGCNKSFTRAYNLRSHIRTHLKERPFQCEHCELRFARLHDKNRHERLHRGIRPFVCEHCEHKFARVDALSRHLKVDGGRNVCNMALVEKNSPKAMPLVDLPPKPLNPLIVATMERMRLSSLREQQQASSDGSTGANTSGDDATGGSFGNGSGQTMEQ